MDWRNQVQGIDAKYHAMLVEKLATDNASQRILKDFADIATNTNSRNLFGGTEIANDINSLMQIVSDLFYKIPNEGYDRFMQYYPEGFKTSCIDRKPLYQTYQEIRVINDAILECLPLNGTHARNIVQQFYEFIVRAEIPLLFADYQRELARQREH